MSTGNSTSQAAATSVRALVRRRRAERPTAIFAGNNRCTVGALTALGAHARGVTIVGFDDFELADVLEITTVRTDPYRIGQLATELAFGRIDGDDRGPQRVVVPAELIVRG